MRVGLACPSRNVVYESTPHLLRLVTLIITYLFYFKKKLLRIGKLRVEQEFYPDLSQLNYISILLFHKILNKSNQ
jgi:hypothetical protein